MVKSVKSRTQIEKSQHRQSFSSALLRRLSRTLRTAVSVLWFFLYADCRISRRLFTERWVQLIKHCFLENLWQEWHIGDRSTVFLDHWHQDQLFLNRGVTTACLNWQGTVPDDSEQFISRVTPGARSPRQHSIREVGMGSRTQLLVGDPEIRFWIMSSVTGSKRASCVLSKTEKEGNSQEQESRSSRMRRIFSLRQRMRLTSR